MSRWDISPSGVQGVLSRTETVAQDFEGQMKRLGAALDGAMAQTQPSSEIVASAIVGFMEQLGTPAIEFVFTRTGACMTGAAQATRFYLQGDLEMAANAQAAVSAAPDPAATMPGGRAVPR